MAHTSQRWGCGEELAERLHWHAHSSLRQGEDCSFLIFRPLEGKARAEKGHRADACDPLPALAERIRPHVRHSDTLELDPCNAVAIVLHAAGQQGTHAVFQRLRELLTAPPLPNDRTFTIAIGHASGATESGDERTIANTIRDAWKPRMLLNVALSIVPEQHAPHPARTMSQLAEPGERKRKAAPLPDVAPTRSTRRAHLRLIALQSPAQPVDEGLRTRAHELGVPFVQLPARLPASCRSAIAPELARELSAVPIGRSRSMLTVAMHDPRDATAVLRLRTATGLAIFPVLAAPEELERALHQIARS